MRRLSFAVVALFAILFPAASRGDVPATEFFVIETKKLSALAPTDTQLDALSSAQLSEISVWHGWYNGGLSMVFKTTTFHLDARFSAAADTSNRGPASIHYTISAGGEQERSDLASTDGTAVKQSKQFITEDWRLRQVVVILRFLDFKH